jgi:hypothetical protein
MSGSSLALNNLRGAVIFIVVAFHAVSAYLGSLAPSAYVFDRPPYLWRAFPIVDTHRWFGFDIFCAWQDVCLMCLMFFLSALFAWPSLERKGTWGFLNNRLLRLGVPCLFGLTVVMPIALYPVYRVTATDPGVAGYLRHLFALPFWPNGPMWFLWQLLALTFVAAALRAFVPRFVEFLARHSAGARERPFRYFVFVTIAAALAYVPMALIFTPMRWADTGLFAVQFCRPLLYTTVYIAGLAMGAGGLGQGLFAPGGMLAPRWARWVTGALLAFMLWIGLAALSMGAKDGGPLALQIGADLAFALACISGCFAAFAVTLRFATSPSRMLGSASENAFGIYVLHYPFVVWLQYALLGSALFAVAKGSLVFAGSLLCSWALAIAFRSVPFASALVGGERRAFSRRPAAAPRLVTPRDGDDDIRLTHIAR